MAKRDSVKPAWSFEFTEAEFADWWGLAACMDHPNADHWFAENVTDQAQQDAARNVCKVCPVQAKCLSYAMERPELEGMWGGVTHRERKAAVTGKPIYHARRGGQCCKGHDLGLHGQPRTRKNRAGESKVFGWRCMACDREWSRARRLRKKEAA